MKLTYMKLTNISHMKLRTEPESSARARPRPPAHTHTHTHTHTSFIATAGVFSLEDRHRPARLPAPAETSGHGGRPGAASATAAGGGGRTAARLAGGSGD